MGRQAARVRSPEKVAAPTRAPRRAVRAAVVKRKPLPDLTGLPPERQIALLKKDREGLLAALEAAEAKAAALEARQAKVADQVAWALDTLRDLVGDQR